LKVSRKATEFWVRNLMEACLLHGVLQNVPDT